MDASFEEKSVWIQLIGLGIGLAGYLVAASRLLGQGVDAMSAYASLFMVAVVGLVIFLIVGHALAAALERPEKRDERDRVIAWRAEHRTSWIVPVGLLAGVTCLVFDVQAVWTANVLLLSLAVSEVLRLALRAVYYRRGV